MVEGHRVWWDVLERDGSGIETCCAAGSADVTVESYSRIRFF